VWTISLADRSIASLIPNPSGVHVSAFVNSGTPAANANKCARISSGPEGSRLRRRSKRRDRIPLGFIDRGP
jgi:hypothetical protein